MNTYFHLYRITLQGSLEYLGACVYLEDARRVASAWSSWEITKHGKVVESKGV